MSSWIELELPVDRRRCVDVVGQGSPAGRWSPSGIGRQMLGVPSGLSSLSRIRLFLVERFDRCTARALTEATSSQRRWRSAGLRVADVLGLLREQGRNRRKPRAEAEQPLDVLVSTKSITLLTVLFGADEVGLVDHDRDLLAPLADVRHELALPLGERAIGGGDEEDQIGARHEPLSQRLMLTDDGVRAGCIDNA